MATYYVASNGSDSNAGTSASAPWLTIAKVNSSAAASDTIRWRRGDTFNDATLAVKASQTHDTYGSGSTRPIIDGAGLRVACTITGISSASLGFIRLKNAYQSSTFNSCTISGACSGLRFTSTQFYGEGCEVASSSSGSDNVWTQCRFDGTFHDGMQTNGSGTYTFNDCRWHEIGGATGSGGADPISAHDTTSFTVNRGVFTDCQRGAGLSIGSGTYTFSRCFVRTNNGASAAGLVFAYNGSGTMNCRNCKVLMKGSNLTIAFQLQGSGTMNVDNCSTLNNNSHASSVSWYHDGGNGSLLRVRNSVSKIGTGAGGHAAISAAASVTTAQYDEDNCRYHADGAARFAIAAVTMNFATWDATNIPGVFTVDGSAVADPVYADATSAADGPEDLKLQSTSTLIGAGLDLSATYTQDYFGHKRGTVFDIGAHEYKTSGAALLGEFVSISLEGDWSLAKRSQNAEWYTAEDQTLTYTVSSKDLTNGTATWTAKRGETVVLTKTTTDGIALTGGATSTLAVELLTSDATSLTTEILQTELKATDVDGNDRMLATGKLSVVKAT